MAGAGAFAGAGAEADSGCSEAVERAKPGVCAGVDGAGRTAVSGAGGAVYFRREGSDCGRRGVGQGAGAVCNGGDVWLRGVSGEVEGDLRSAASALGAGRCGAAGAAIDCGG